MTKNVQYGDPLVLDNEILRTTVGSEVHGIHVPGTEDHDEMGIYIEPPEYVFSPTQVRDNYVSRTKPEGQRSGISTSQSRGTPLCWCHCSRRQNPF